MTKIDRDVNLKNPPIEPSISQYPPRWNMEPAAFGNMVPDAADNGHPQNGSDPGVPSAPEFANGPDIRDTYVAPRKSSPAGP